MSELIIPLVIAGILAGFIQYLVDYKGLQVYDIVKPGIALSPQSADVQNGFLLFLNRVWEFIKRHWRFFGYIIIGISGALLTPVINEWTNDKLPGIVKIKEYVECISKPGVASAPCTPYSFWYTVVLLGYGIIFGYSAVRIIRSIGAFFLGNVASFQQRIIQENEIRLADAQKLIEGLNAKLAVAANPSARPPAFNLEIERSLAEEYFNEARNEIDKRTYYASIRFGDQKSLPQQLRKLVINTHKIKFNYKPALHLYPLVDRYPDGLLKSIYSNVTFSLETLLRLDADIEKAREEQFASFVSVNSLQEDIAAGIEEIENRLPYNCEHVVPQSWFGKVEPMRGDLHHLFTCEVSCNEFRDDDKYFDFDDYEASGPCGKRKDELFEPEKNKGIAARAVLYFIIRYPKVFKPGKGYFKKDISMLIKWHKKQAVTLYEKHRNQEIYKKQGNRNPFIDFPEIVDKLDFGLLLTSAEDNENSQSANNTEHHSNVLS